VKLILRSFVVAAALAACQGSSEPGNADTTPDLPAVCDGVTVDTPDNALILTSPAAMATHVSGPLVFDVDVPGTVTHADIEQAIAVRAGGAPIAGSFSWVPQARPGTLRPGFVLTFTPASGWPGDADITVRVTPHGTFRPRHALRDLAAIDTAGGWQTAFSTRNSARIALARSVSKDGRTIAYVHLALSELAPAEAIANGLQITVGGAPIAGSLDVHSGASRDFQYTFAQQVSTDADIEVALAPPARAGVLAEPMRWDAHAAAAGKLTLHASSATACPRESGCWEWRPST
jgi:hypothetical protein